MALCNLGQSSKTGSDSLGFTGEKGIGFKSVFRVADVVSVTSGDYSFRFDAKEPLGMICPSPADFPGTGPRPGWTSFHLRMKPADENPELRAIVESALAELRPTVLAFLRNLRRISITDVRTQRSRTLVRRIVHSHLGEVLELFDNDTKASFVVRRRLVTGIPRESRRGNEFQSEVIVAFPIGPCDSPYPKLQDVFSFLPVKDFGFKVSFNATNTTHLRCPCQGYVADTYLVHDSSELPAYSQSGGN